MGIDPLATCANTRRCACCHMVFQTFSRPKFARAVDGLLIHGLDGCCDSWRLLLGGFSLYLSGTRLRPGLGEVGGWFGEGLGVV